MSAIFAEMNAQVGATKSSNVRQQSLRLYLGGPHAFLTKYGGGFGRFHTDGHVESDNNIVECVFRPIP
ncbi:hypothetical protein [Leisingera thetidis]|uniref:hypothetical protein n=1 Tax=Leisingera thetidis TaxID=2930199 RepID=UPI0021F78E07|nr:hypothetical protein [Leisingera thetidis]